MKFLLVSLLSTVILAAALPFAGYSQAPASPAAQAPANPSALLPAENLPPGSASRGEALFEGRVRLHNGGPACAECHSIAGLPFPDGGTLGPNLTSVYKKLGHRGIGTTMTTLFFPTMTAIYDPHPLTLQERADLIAFFQQAQTRTPARWNTRIILLIAIAGFLILLGITQFVWRGRLRSVRASMVARAGRQRGAAL
ncbi:MAG: hypothetical protein ACRD1N_02775 [Terriglobia bacterium]